MIAKNLTCKEFDLLDSFLVWRPLQTCSAVLQILGASDKVSSRLGGILLDRVQVQSVQEKCML